MLTGDATNADPVCELSPHHHLVVEAVEKADRPTLPAGVKPIVFRDDRNSRELSRKKAPTTPVA
jgi:pyrroloquinoline quinone biosynthesis protein E